MQYQRREQGRKAVLVIPALNPTTRLLTLLAELRSTFSSPQAAGLLAGIVVVNDGSAAEYNSFFRQAEEEYGCTVLRHSVNLGKGRALKTAFNHVLASHTGLTGVVTLDADGQHAPADVLAVTQELAQNPEALVLGSRNFNDPIVPAKSRAGNKITRQVFRLLCGVKVRDTQTGLRGIPAGFLPQLMTLPGERFEYEMNMLIESKEAGISIREVSIATIYHENNAGTHFNPLKDAVKVYSVFFKYVFGGLSSFLIDIIAFSLFLPLFRGIAGNQYILAATICSRVVSSLYNFLFNRQVVFRGQNGASPFLRYYLLTAVQMLVSAGLVSLIHFRLPLAEVPIKIFVDLVLFFVNFQVQRAWVFRAKKPPPSL